MNENRVSLFVLEMVHSLVRSFNVAACLFVYCTGINIIIDDHDNDDGDVNKFKVYQITQFFIGECLLFVNGLNGK